MRADSESESEFEQEKGDFFKEPLSKVTQEEMEENDMYGSIGALTFISDVHQIQPATAFLVSEDTIITAAHAVCSKNGTWYTGHKFYPGINGQLIRDHPFHTPETIHVPKEYFNKESRAGCDYAFIKLSKPVQNAKCLLLGVNFTRLESSVNICGYAYNHHENFNHANCQPADYRFHQYQRTD